MVVKSFLDRFISNIVYVITGLNKQYFYFYLKRNLLGFKIGVLQLKQIVNSFIFTRNKFLLLKKELFTKLILVIYNFLGYSSPKAFKYYPNILNFIIRNLIVALFIYFSIKGILLFISYNRDAFLSNFDIHPVYHVATRIWPAMVFIGMFIAIIFQLSLYLMFKSLRIIIKPYLGHIFLWNLMLFYVFLCREAAVAHSNVGIGIWWKPAVKPYYVDLIEDKNFFMWHTFNEVWLINLYNEIKEYLREFLINIDIGIFCIYLDNTFIKFLYLIEIYVLNSFGILVI